jgi:HEAT repeat protein
VKSTADLVEEFASRGPGVSEAAAHLVSRGDEAVDAIFARAKRKLVSVPPRHLDLVAAAATSATFDRLMSWIDDDNYVVEVSAYLALGHLGDRRAARPIAERLVGEQGERISMKAGTALILLGDTSIADILRCRVDAWLAAETSAGIEALLAMASDNDASRLLWPLMVSAALTACGDQRGAPLAFQIATLPTKTLKTMVGGINLHGSFCKELRHFAARGLLAAVDTAMKIGDAKQVLAQVLAFIGTRDALDLLTKIAAVSNRETSEAAAAWINAVAGADLPESDDGRYGPIAAAWWKNTGAKLASGTCLWGGAPWQSGVLFDRLGEQYSEADEELMTVLGIRLGHETRKRGKSRAETIAELRREAAVRFTPGRLYRYGFEYDPAIVSESD